MRLLGPSPVCLAIAVAIAGGCAEPGEGERQLLSPVYTVDRGYRSMTGPQATQVFSLDAGDPELVWITGYEATMVGADGSGARSQEYMCHSNLNVTLDEHLGRFPGARHEGGRLFTLSQGQTRIDLPEGFGIPAMSDEPLRLTTQVLNLNWRGEAVDVRHKVRVRFVRDRDLAHRPMRPLFMRGVYGLALLEGDDGYFGLEGEARPQLHGPGCLVGENASDREYADGEGRRFTGHWVVPPGRQVNRTLVTRILDLPYDTTAHYIAVHLHPFAESIELNDLTRGETVFRSRVEPTSGRIGIARVEHLSSVEGLPLYRDHEYEVVSVYDNPTAEPHDAMAVLYLYLLDREFRHPSPAIASTLR